MTRILDRETWILLALGLVLRLGYGGYVLSRGISIPSMDEYETIAVNLLDQGRYAGLPEKPTPTAAREPAYPLFIASLYLFFGRVPFAVIAAQAVLSLATCLLIRAVAADLFGGLAGRLALAISAFYPYFVFYCGFFYRETFLTFAAAGLVFLMGRLLKKPSPALACAAGLASGLCAATLSTFLFISAAIALWFVWTFRSKPRAGALIASFLAGAALFPGLWIARNFAVFHRFIPGSTLGGFNLYTALIVPEEARGTDQEIVYERADPHWSRILGMSALMADDGSQQAEFLKVAGERVKDHPRRYLAHAGKQALKLWRFYPYERRYQHSYALIKTLSLLSDGWLIPVGLIGLFLFWRRSPLVPFFAVLLFSATATYALISAIVRYRLPLMVPLIVLSSGALAERLGRLRAGR